MKKAVLESMSTKGPHGSTFIVQGLVLFCFITSLGRYKQLLSRLLAKDDLVILRLVDLSNSKPEALVSSPDVVPPSNGENAGRQNFKTNSPCLKIPLTLSIPSS